MHTLRDLSVVIPAFNHERFVAEAVESVRAQSLRPRELVVVDDGSTDGTARVLDAAADGAMTLIRQENRGAHAALNRGIARARGPWIAILNSDDVFAPDHLEGARGVAAATGAALVLGRVRLVDEDGAPLSPDHDTARWYREALTLGETCASLSEALARHNVAVTTSNFVFHKELWRRLGGFRPYRYVHDYDFLLRAVAAAPLRVVFENTLAGVAYRVHGSNTIREDVDRALAERASMLRTHRSVLARARSVLRGPATRRALRAAVDADATSSPRPSRPPAAAAVRCGLVVTELDAGGLEEVVALLAGELPAQGIEPHVLCTASGGDVARRLARSGVSVTVATTPGQRSRWMEHVRPQLLSTHFVSADVLAELTDGGIPAVETIHNAYVWFSAREWTREADKQRCLRGTIAVSAAAAAYYGRHLPGATAPLAVIPNGVAAARVYSVPRPFARRVLALPTDAPVLVQLGRIEPQKNQAVLLDAFRSVVAAYPDAVLVLAGDVSDRDYATGIRERFADLLASGGVRMNGPRSDVGTLLSAADAYVANSWFEGWSLGATEALWTGLPLVLSDCGGSQALVGPSGERGTVVPNPAGDPLEVTLEAMARPDPHRLRHNREALAAALLDTLGQRDVWASRRADIRAHARTHFGAATVAARYAEVFRGLLS